MLYIKELILSNFQSHEYTQLSFNEGVNTIIGPSDSGKTSIIRAIRWVLYNEPNGDFFIRKGTNEAFVKILFNNDYSITRGRNKTRNYYIIETPDGDVTRLEGFGANIPAEVIEITKIQKLDLDRSWSMELNINHQLDAPFILSESPSFKSNALGKLAGVDRIDKAMTEVTGDINKLKSKKNFLLERKVKLKEQLDSFKNLKHRTDRMEKLLSIKNYLIEKKERLEKLQFLLRMIQEITSNIAVTKDYLSKFQQINQIEDITNDINRMYFDKYKKLLLLDLKYNHLKQQSMKCKHILKSTESINELSNRINHMSEIIYRFNRIKVLNNKYRIIDSDIKKNTFIVENSNVKELSELFSHINEKFTQLQRFNLMYQNINTTTKRIKNGNEYLKKYVALEDSNHNILRANDLYRRLTQLQKLYKSWHSNYLEEKKILKAKENIVSTLLSNVTEYENLIREYSICPFCNSPIDKEHIETILEEYK